MSQIEVTSIQIEKQRILFSYNSSAGSFQRGLVFPPSVDLQKLSRDAVFQKLVRYAALADCIYTFGIEYYDVVKIPCVGSQREKDFFENAYFHGLAEFRYTNGIALDTKTEIQFSAIIDDKPTRTGPASQPANINRGFVLNGGGKDGIVAIEIAKELGLNLEWFVSGDAKSRQRVVKSSPVQTLFSVQRYTDGFVKRHKKYSGHKPMSLYVAMVSALAAYVEKRYYVIAANEYSANFSNLIVDGYPINHQYTKSYEFEVSLRRLFEAEDVPVCYFSITRPLFELQVMKIFSKLPAYHQTFLSCNVGMGEDRWCMSCAKCAFVIGAMYMYSPQSATEKWGSKASVYGRPGLLENTIELINPDLKPFECIGTLAENLILVNEVIKDIKLSNDQASRLASYSRVSSQSVEPIELDVLQTSNDFPPALSDTIKTEIARYM